MGLFKRVRDQSLDFKGMPASQGVYSIHPYPAMFHFLVVRRFIDEFTSEGQRIFDPFCGSGVCAVESYRLNRNFIGFDVNPLAILISKVRTTPINSDILFKTLDFLLNTEVYEYTIPVFHNIEYWFGKDVIVELAKLKAKIYRLEDENIKNFFKVAFSETVRKVSNADNSEFKLVRRKEIKPIINVKEVFYEVSCKNIKGLEEINNINSNSKVYLFERSILEEQEILEDDSVDLVLTSPPYGDSRTTVAYEQFVKLSLRWLELSDGFKKFQLGEKVKDMSLELPSDELYKVLKRIESKDKKRAKEVYSFYHDLYLAVEKIARKVKKGGHVVFMVGNRTVRGEFLPTDKITADFFVKFGFVHLKTLVREISNKRMPHTYMNYEYAVILRKEKAIQELNHKRSGGPSKKGSYRRRAYL